MQKYNHRRLSTITKLRNIRVLLTSFVACLTIAMVPGCGPDTAAYLDPRTQLTSQQSPVDFSAYKTADERVTPQSHDVAFAVSLSGGGHRSASLALGGLIGLERLKRQQSGGIEHALQEIDYLSSVSGGSFAAAAFITDLREHAAAGPYSMEQRMRSSDRYRGLQAEYHTPLLVGIFDPGVLWGRTRAHHMQRAIDSHLLSKNDGDSLRLSDVFIPADSAEPLYTPLWLVHSTNITNGDLFAFVPSRLAEHYINGFWENGNVVLMDECAENHTYECYHRFAGHVPFAAAVTASGAFPAVIPPTKFVCDTQPRKSYVQLTDGGESDNLAIYTALEMLGQKSNAGKRQVLLVIDGYNSNLTPHTSRWRVDEVEGIIQAPQTPLRAAHRRYQQVATALATVQSHDGKPRTLFMGFEMLADLKDESELYETGWIDEQQMRLVRKQLKCSTNTSLFQLTQRITTQYVITAELQHFLIAVGIWMVEKNEALLRQYLWNE